jgi:hypothetical protein
MGATKSNQQGENKKSFFLILITKVAPAVLRYSESTFATKLHATLYLFIVSNNLALSSSVVSSLIIRD